MAHARPLSPPLTLTPRRPEQPLHGRAPAGCHSGHKRARANRCWQTSKTTTHTVGRVHTAALANADAGHPLHLPLSSPSSPCTAPGVFSQHPSPTFTFFRLDHTTTTPLTHQRDPRASLLLSHAGRELFVLPAPEKKVATVAIFDQALPPFPLCLLPLSNPTLMCCFFSCAQELQLELGRSSPAPAQDGKDARTLDTTCSEPAHATITNLSLTSPPPNHIVASFSDEP
jgi:hypothetical protein